MGSKRAPAEGRGASPAAQDPCAAGLERWHRRRAGGLGTGASVRRAKQSAVACTLATVCARCKLWVATRDEQQLPRSRRGLLATMKQPQEHRRCARSSAFLRFYGLFGWVHLGVVHRCLTTDGCHGADAVHGRCNNPPSKLRCGGGGAGGQGRGGAELPKVGKRLFFWQELIFHNHASVSDARVRSRTDSGD